MEFNYSLAKCQSSYHPVAIMATTLKICHNTEQQKLPEQYIDFKKPSNLLNSFEVTSDLFVYKVAITQHYINSSENLL